MRHTPPPSESVGAVGHGDRRRSEAGDTLVEILIALAVIGIASTAILLAFATSISGSGAHRNVTTMDTMLRTAAAEVTADIQQQGSAVFANCSGAYTVNNTPGSIPLPAAGYTATVTGAQYWLVSGSSQYTFSPVAPPTNAGCPSGYYAAAPAQPGNPGPQQLTVQVSFKGTSQSITTVVQNPISAASGTACSYPASQLAWVQQPDNGNAGSALFPAPTVVVEDKTGCVVQNDLSQVQLAIHSGPSGATLSNCVPNLGYGETTFQNCSLSTIGSYTLSVTDPTDSITTPVVGNTFSITAGVPAQLVFKQQPGNGTGGTALTTQPIVWIEDASGNVIQGDSTAVTLAIGTNPSGGTLSGCTSTTTNGVATFAGCKIDKAGTGYTLTATDAADNLTVPSQPSAPFNITVGPAFQLGFTTSPGTTVAGDPFGTQPVVAIQDAGGNTVTTNTSTVSLAIGTNPASGTLSGCTGTTTAGVATFAGCKINNAGNGYTLTATDGTLQPGTSSAFNIVTPALTSFKVVPATNAPTAGTPFNVTITGLDQSGFTFPGLTGTQTIAFSGPANSPNGTTPIYPASVSFTGGVGTAAVTLYDAQTTHLTATEGLVTGTSSTITVSPLATPVSFTVANPGTQTAGTAFSETITAADQYGNAASGYTGNHTLTFSGPSNAPNGKAPAYPGQVNFTNGVGTATITLYDAQTTALKASATSPTLTGTSPTFTVNPGAPGSFGLSNPGTQTAGTAFNVTITATDGYGNAATSYAGPQNVTFSGPSNSPNGTTPTYPTSVTFANGVGTASITLFDAQTTALTASQGAASGTSGTFAVNGTGTVSTFNVSAPGTATVGTAFNVTITAADPYGNGSSGYSGAKAVAFSGPSNSPNGHAPTYPASVTFTNGVGTASVTLFDAQTTAVTATQGALSGTSGPITVNPLGSPTGYSVANPGPQVAGTAFNATVTAVDTYGNTVTSYGGSCFSFFGCAGFNGPASSPSGTNPSYPGFIQFTNGVYTGSITLYDAQSTTLTFTNGSLTGTSSSFTVSPSTASSFTVSNPGTQTAGTAFNETITTLDAYGNTATGYTGARAVAFSGPSNSPNGTAPVYPASVTFTAGVGTASITLTDAQTTTLTAIQGSITGTSSSFTVNGGAAASSYTVANPGTQTAGTAFNVTITATDSYGNTATGYAGAKAVTFSGPSNSPSGHAPTYPASATFTAGVGTASVTLFDAQSTTLTATQGTITGTSSSFTVNGGATASSYTVANPGTQTAGTAFNVTITAIDAFGNTATGYAGAKAVVFSGPSNSPNGHAPTYPASVTFTGGVGSASVTLYDVQTTTLTATQGTVTGTSSTFAVNPAGASTFSVPTPGTQTAGVAFNETITALDSYGNAATGYTGAQAIAFSGPSNSPSGTAPTYPASVSFTAGVGTASITLTDAQTTTLTATQGTISGTSGSFTVNSTGTTTKFALSTPSPTAGTAFSETITAVDTYGNTTTGYSGAKAVAFSGPASSPNSTAPSYPASVTFTNGVGTATMTLFDVQSTTLTATQGTISGTSATFAVAPSVASKFTVSTPGPQTAGTAFSVTITAFDAYGNAATTYTGSQALTFSGPATSPNGHAPTYPGSVTFTGGVGSASVTLYDVQTTTLTASQGPITGTSGSFTVNPAGASKFSVPTPATQTAGTAFNETITAIDTYGNTATGYTGAQAVVFSGPSNSPNSTAPIYPASVSFTAGVGTASITLTDAQSTTLTATQGSVSGTSGSFTVNPAGAKTFAVANPGTQTAGTAFNETITAIDTYGNTATGYTGAQAVAFSGPASSPSGHAPTYPASVSFTAGVGTASVTLFDAQSTTMTATQGTVSGTSTSFTVNGGATASSYTVANPGTQTAGTAFNVTITAMDAYGNTATGYAGAKSVAFSGPGNSPNSTAPTYPATVTFSAGVGTASVTLFDAQSTTLTATQGTATGTSTSFTVNPAGASKFSVPTPATQTAGTAFNETITAIDTYGNTATGYTGAQAVVFSGPSNSPNSTAPIYPASVSFTAGVGTASITLTDAQSTTLTATQGSVSGTSGSFTVNSTGTTTKFALSTPSPTAGTAFNETVTALDTYGNTTTGYSGAKSIVFSGPSNSPNSTAPTYPGSVTFTGGVGTASVNLFDAQSTTLTATQGTVSGTSATFAVSPATASTFTVPTPVTQTAGSAFNETLTALDPYGNTATGYTGAQAVVFSGPSNSPNGHAPTYPATVNFTGGVGTASITLTDAQSTTLIATQGSVTGTSGSFTVNSTGTTTAFTVSNPGTQTAGTAFSVAMTAIDTYGNTTTGYAGSKSVTFTGPANSPNAHAPTYPATVTFTGGTASPSITLFDAQSTTLTATQGSIAGTSTSFTVNSTGATTAFTVANPGTQTAGTAFSVTITAIDTYGNTTTGYAGSKSVTFTGPANSPNSTAPTYPGTVTFTSGVGTPSVTLVDAQSTTLTATQGTIAGTSTSFTVQAGSAASITIVSGSGQSTARRTGFANPLVAKVADGDGNAVSGASVTFTAPSSGSAASVVFASSGTNSEVDATNASGQATSSSMTANNHAGTYNISATVGTHTVNFSETNT